MCPHTTIYVSSYYVWRNRNILSSSAPEAPPACDRNI